MWAADETLLGLLVRANMAQACWQVRVEPAQATQQPPSGLPIGRAVAKCELFPQLWWK